MFSLVSVLTPSLGNTSVEKRIHASYNILTDNRIYLFIDDDTVERLCGVRPDTGSYESRVNDYRRLNRYIILFDKSLRVDVNVTGNPFRAVVEYNITLYNVTVYRVAAVVREPQDYLFGDVSIVNYSVSSICSPNTLSYKASYTVFNGTLPYMYDDGQWVFRGSNIYYIDRSPGLERVRLAVMYTTNYYFERDIVDSGQVMFLLFNETVPGPGYSCCNISFIPPETLEETTIKTAFGSFDIFGDTVERAYGVDYVIETVSGPSGMIEERYFLFDDTGFRYLLGDFTSEPVADAVLHSAGFLLSIDYSSPMAGYFIKGILGPELLEEYGSRGSGGYGYLGFVQGDSPEEIVLAVSKPATPLDVHDVKVKLVYVDYQVVTIEVGGNANRGILLAGLGVALILGLTLWKRMRANRKGSTTPMDYH